MRFKLRTLILMFLLTGPALWCVNRYIEYQRYWNSFASNSLSRTFWEQNSHCNRFQYLKNIDDRYFDFRYMEGFEGEDTRWTMWRTPLTSNALSTHIDHFDLAKGVLDDRVVAELRSLPIDWQLKPNTQEVWERRNSVGAEMTYFAMFLLVDRDAGLIYFYDKDKDVPP